MPADVYSPAQTGVLKDADLRWLPRLEMLCATFSRVFVYDQSSLKDRPEAFLNALYDFLGFEFTNDFTTRADERSSNLGVRSVRQVNRLIQLNKLNARLGKIHPRLNLYAQKLQRRNLSPRGIVQFRTRVKENEARFALPKDLCQHLSDGFDADYSAALKYVSY